MINSKILWNNCTLFFYKGNLIFLTMNNYRLFFLIENKIKKNCPQRSELEILYGRA